MPFLLLLALGGFLWWQRSTRQAALNYPQLPAGSVKTESGQALTIVPKILYELAASRIGQLSPSEVVGLQNAMTQQAAQKQMALADLAIATDSGNTTAQFKFINPEKDGDQVLRVGDQIRLGSGNFVYPFTITAIARLDGQSA